MMWVTLDGRMHTWKWAEGRSRPTIACLSRQAIWSTPLNTSWIQLPPVAPLTRCNQLLRHLVHTNHTHDAHQHRSPQGLPALHWGPGQRPTNAILPDGKASSKPCASACQQRRGTARRRHQRGRPAEVESCRGGSRQAAKGTSSCTSEQGTVQLPRLARMRAKTPTHARPRMHQATNACRHMHLHACRISLI